MEIIVKKPKFEPRFVATIYTTDEQPDVYRVNIGKEATDTGMGNDENPIGKYHEQSDFLEMEEVDDWIDKQVAALRKDGKRIEFDKNASYIMNRAIGELADESPITV